MQLTVVAERYKALDMSQIAFEQDALPKVYESAAVESEIYTQWLGAKSFAATPDERPVDRRYVIMMPLPNVTGALHMGHAMDNVMQDLLTRWHRMMGDNTLWMPGTDHAGIATQAVVEKRLKELEGLTRHDLGRDKLVERIWQWKDQYQARIIAQQQRMGCSCDWDRQRFTMDETCTKAVRQAFFRLFADGLIFRGKRLVNWDVYLQTSISDDEVYYETVQGNFWHLRYPVIDPQPGEPTSIIVATTRPETMLGDTAVAVHPDPAAALAAAISEVEAALAKSSEKEREALQAQLAALNDRQATLLPQLIQLRDMARAGRCVQLPLVNRPIPLICDDWAKPELGSGCVKITPAHDPNDYAVWTRHQAQIDILNILNPDGTLNAAAGSYAGQDRYEARKRVVADLKTQGLLDKIEERSIEVGHSDRSKSIIEPYLSDQWFVYMGDREAGVVMGQGTAKEHRSAGLVQAAMDAVTDGRVKIHPERYTKTYLDWLSEKRDWPISRQLWWGHRIPVWSKRGNWGDLNWAQGATVLSATAIARLYVPQTGDVYALTSAQLPQACALAHDTTCVIDVCLLQDNAEQVAQLERAGFVQDPDVLDTWFSSALWPFSTLGWPQQDWLSYYYPGSCLVTGRDIITLWVARMVLAGLYNVGDVPFSDVFIHANILDGKGERMSKSKGNGIDPVDIIDRYGTDAMRYVLCDMQTGTQDIRLPVTAICAKCGHENDLGDTAHGSNVFTYICGKPISGKLRPGACGAEFDVLGTMPNLPSATLVSERFEQGRAFCTKLWNSARFAFMNLEAVPPGDLKKDQLQLEDRWVLDQLNLAVTTVNAQLRAYNPSAALGAARDFFWSALCDWYLELIKPRLAADADATSAAAAKKVLAYCLDQVLRLLHPFVPFITEHLWQRLNTQVPQRSIGSWAQAPRAPLLIGAAWPIENNALKDAETQTKFDAATEIVRKVREVRSAYQVHPKEPKAITLAPLSTTDTRALLIQDPQTQQIVKRMANAPTISFVTTNATATGRAGSANAMTSFTAIYVHDVVDATAEKVRLEKELQRVEKEIQVCEKKLGTPSFVERAPAAVITEQKERLASYVANRDAIIRSLAEL